MENNLIQDNPDSDDGNKSPDQNPSLDEDLPD